MPDSSGTIADRLSCRGGASKESGFRFNGGGGERSGCRRGASFPDFAANKVIPSIRGLDNLSVSNHSAQHVGTVIPEPVALVERFVIIESNGVGSVERLGGGQGLNDGILGPFDLPGEHEPGQNEH